jgi:cytochrome P450
MTTGIRLDQTFVIDPWQTYRRIAGDGPVQHVILPDGSQGWLVTGYDEARTLLDDPRLSKDIKAARKLWLNNTPPFLQSPLAEHMLHSDPPDHTRLRRLVNRAFTPRAVARLRIAIASIADDLLDGMGDAGQADLVDAYAFPLPIAVISELLGVPHEDRDRVREWSGAFVSQAPPEATTQAAREFSMYLGDLIQDKRATPGPEDLLSDLLKASDGSDYLRTHEVLSMAFLLLVAGHETTVSLITNAVYSLLRHPDQMELLRDDAGLMSGTVEEALRYEGPVHIATLRITTEPVAIAGVEIPPGEHVHISLPAANRDTGRFPEPDRFDITPRYAGPSRLRPRHPLLPRCSTGPLGRRDRTSETAGEVPAARTRRR